MEPEKIKKILEYVKDNQDLISYDEKLFTVREGDLLSLLEREIRAQLSGDSGNIALMRAAPVNVLNKIVSKLSKLYSCAPVRKTENPVDQELVDYYAQELGVNIDFNDHNENFNTNKKSAMEIYLDTKERLLKTRAMPGHYYIPYSDDPIDPLRMTHFVKLMGEFTDSNGVKFQKYWIYSNDEFVSVNEKGDLLLEDMAETEGVNSYGLIPFNYVKKSRYLLVPKKDSDILQMTLLVPVLLTDMNFASMFLSMPILYTIDVDSQNLKLSPNHFWNLKSIDDEKTPQIGVIKAEPNLESQMNNVVNQLSLWLESKNIKPGTVGKLSAENFSSGVSKLISEMDTLEDRKMQEVVFQDVEQDFWYRLATIHNILAKAGRIENRKLFSDPEKFRVSIRYTEEKIIESRGDKVTRLKTEVDSRFTSREMAIKDLNPYMHEDEVKKLMAAIQKEGAGQETEIEAEEEKNGTY